jgi:hypothetical protein
MGSESWRDPALDSALSEGSLVRSQLRPPGDIQDSAGGFSVLRRLKVDNAAGGLGNVEKAADFRVIAGDDIGPQFGRAGRGSAGRRVATDFGLTETLVRD